MPARRIVPGLVLASLLWGSTGCYSIRNGWLDPTVLGNFSETTTLDIRTSLTLEDAPPGIAGAVLPTPEDLEYVVRDYPFSPGDTLSVIILELIDRQLPFEAQLQITPPGDVNIPIVGRVHAAGLTPTELEQKLVDRIRALDILLDPEVTVTPIYLQKATYSIFGVGVSAATNAPLRAGTFPIRRPDLKVLEAINQVGGLNEFVVDIYVFRTEQPEDVMPAPAPEQPLDTEPDGDVESDRDVGADTDVQDAEALLAAVLADGEEGGDRAAGVEEMDDLLKPEPIEPYIWVNDEFVRNPKLTGSTMPVVSSGIPPANGAAAVVDWSRLAGDARYRIIRISAEALRSGSQEQNIYVQAGDVIRIVSGQIGLYYVMGQVGRVGPYSFNSEEITLKAAIAAAGGLSGLAWPDRCTVYRRLGQREQMIQVNLDRIFSGKDPDFVIKRGDIINVGTHPLAPFLQRVRAITLPNPSSTVGYSFLYSRNFADIDSYSVKQNPANRAKTFPLLFP